ncbi:MAG: sialidase family protein [Thermodesulfobacteriota bacterium]
MTEHQTNQCSSSNRWYGEEWKRTKPDLVVYLPRTRDGNDNGNEHFLVFPSPGGDLLAMWTQSSHEGADDQRVVLSRSKDDGVSWTAPEVIAGKEGPNDTMASWGFPVVSATGRIYCFYNKRSVVEDVHHQITGTLNCRYSDDDGHTWHGETVLAMPRRKTDHPDPSIPANWIVWQKPGKDPRGRWLVGFTRWTSKAVRWTPPNVRWPDWDSRIELMRFDNIDEEPLPEHLQISWFPEDGEALCVPHPRYRQISVAQEPSIVNLPDGRLFMTVRTFTGHIWYSISEDGEKWNEPAVLRYRDGGEAIQQPLCCCPIYAFEEGRYILLYHNNDGHFQDYGPYDTKYNRRPAFIALGEYRSQAQQPIWFSRPKLFCDSDGVPLGPLKRTEVATYTSFTERKGKRVLWYPDRKFFLLGRYITDEWLEGLKVPT